MLGRIVVRRLSSLAEPLPQLTHGRYPVPNSSKYKQLMERQKLFCREDGRLVWEKTSADSAQYRAAFGAALLATLLSVLGIWKAISPPKNQ